MYFDIRTLFKVVCIVDCILFRDESIDSQLQLLIWMSDVYFEGTAQDYEILLLIAHVLIRPLKRHMVHNYLGKLETSIYHSNLLVEAAGFFFLRICSCSGSLGT